MFRNKNQKEDVKQKEKENINLKNQESNIEKVSNEEIIQKNKKLELDIKDKEVEHLGKTILFLKKRWQILIVFGIGFICGWIWSIVWSYIVTFFIGYLIGYFYLLIKKNNTNKDKDEKRR